MLHLLKIEWLKLKNYRTFWVLAILFPLSLTGINLIVYNTISRIIENKQSKDMANFILGGLPFDYPNVWQAITNVSSYLLVIPGLLMIIFTSNEFSFKTHRQNVIDGLSRSQFIHTKLVMGAIIAFVSTLVVFILCLIFGATSGTPFSFAGSQAILYFFLQALTYCWLALLLGVLLKRSGIALGVFMLYTLILENTLSAVLTYKLNASAISRMLPLESSDMLLPFPAFERDKKQMGIDETNITLQLVFVAIYLIILLILSKKRFETTDI